MAIVRALYTRLLPRSLPDDVRERARSHLLVGTMLAHIVMTSLAVGVFYTLVESPSEEAQRVRYGAAVGTLVCLAAILAYYRLTGRRRATANLMAAAVFIVLVSVAAVSGGLAGPIPLLFLFVPATATLLGDRRSGLAWAVATGVMLIGFAGAEMRGVAFVSVMPPENVVPASRLTLILVFVLVVGALQIYDYQTDRLAEQLQVERNRYAFMAGHDALTSLPNRTTFDVQLARAVARTHRLGIPFALLYLDLDDFKPVNDRLGHQAGDTVLRCVADRLREITRENDMAARIGGDEFAMLLEGIDDPDVADAVATKIVDRIARPIPIGDEPVLVTASVGAVLHPETPGDAPVLERIADEAMYRAKSSGGIHVVGAHPPARV